MCFLNDDLVLLLFFCTICDVLFMHEGKKKEGQLANFQITQQSFFVDIILERIVSNDIILPRSLQEQSLILIDTILLCAWGYSNRISEKNRSMIISRQCIKRNARFLKAGRTSPMFYSRAQKINKCRVNANAE